MFGSYTGATWTSYCPLLLQLLGVERVATGVGLYLMMMGVGYLAGPPAAAAVYTSSLDYNTVFYFAGKASVTS